MTLWLDHAQLLCHQISSLFVFSVSVVAGVSYGYGVSIVCVVVAGCVFAVVVAGGIPLPIEDAFLVGIFYVAIVIRTQTPSWLC